MQKVLTLFIRINVCMLMLMCECNFFSLSLVFQTCSNNISDENNNNNRKKVCLKKQQHLRKRATIHSFALWMTDCMYFCMFVFFLLILHFSPKTISFSLFWSQIFANAKILLHVVFWSHTSGVYRKTCKTKRRKKATTISKHKQTMMSNGECISILCNRVSLLTLK